MKRVKTLMLISLLTASFYSSAGIPVAIDASPNGLLKPQDGQNDSNNGPKLRNIIRVRFRHIKTS